MKAAALNRLLFVLLSAGLLIGSSPSWGQPVSGNLHVHWNEGAEDCKVKPPTLIQVHAYNPQTFILRESLCATFEGNFIYLLIGSSKALLIDTGDVADSKQMPLRDTVMGLLPSTGASKLPLLVVHTHRHLDHRAGDGQFANLPGVEVVAYDLDGVRRYYKFANWPNGVAQVELGDRTIDVIPTPGHEATHVSFYDRNTALLFSGDFLMPGRLLIEDADAALASARRVAAFVRDRPLSYALGAHIEFDRAGNVFPWESTHHPHEHDLQMTKGDLLALPAALANFNGFYTHSGNFVLSNPMHTLIALAVGGLLALVIVLLLVIRYYRSRRRVRT